jgi:predicted transcriptional regulator
MSKVPHSLMAGSKKEMILVIDVLKAISDEKSLELFRMVALTKQHSDILISKTKLTRKQYYSRMSTLMKAGLIEREEGKHTLTAFGRMIYHTSLAAMENAVNNYWKLKAIESLRKSKVIPAAECKNIIDRFIDDPEIKDIFARDGSTSDSQPYAEVSQQQQRHSSQT